MGHLPLEYTSFSYDMGSMREHLSALASDNRRGERLFAAEVVVESAFRNVDRRGDVANAHAGITEALKQRGG